MKRWLLSSFYRDLNDQLRPVATAYGGAWRCPLHPSTDDGFALVEIYSAPNQLEAASQDPRIVICPRVFDPSAIPEAVVSAYSDKGATLGMNIATLLSLLADIEPIFEQDF